MNASATDDFFVSQALPNCYIQPTRRILAFNFVPQIVSPILAPESHTVAVVEVKVPSSI